MSEIHNRLIRILEHGHPLTELPDETEIMRAWRRGFDGAMQIAINTIRADAKIAPILDRSARLADEADWTPSVDADYPR